MHSLILVFYLLKLSLALKSNHTMGPLILMIISMTKKLVQILILFFLMNAAFAYVMENWFWGNPQFPDYMESFRIVLEASLGAFDFGSI